MGFSAYRCKMFCSLNTIHYVFVVGQTCSAQLSSVPLLSRYQFGYWISCWYLTSTAAAELRWHPLHDDVIKWKHFPRYRPFVRGIHRSPVNSPHKGQWRGALMFSFIYAWIHGWVKNREDGSLRRHRAHHDVIVMLKSFKELDGYFFKINHFSQRRNLPTKL